MGLIPNFMEGCLLMWIWGRRELWVSLFGSFVNALLTSDQSNHGVKWRPVLKICKVHQKPSSGSGVRNKFDRLLDLWTEFLIFGLQARRYPLKCTVWYFEFKTVHWLDWRYSICGVQSLSSVPISSASRCSSLCTNLTSPVKIVHETLVRFWIQKPGLQSSWAGFAADVRMYHENLTCFLCGRRQYS